MICPKCGTGVKKIGIVRPCMGTKHDYIRYNCECGAYVYHERVTNPRELERVKVKRGTPLSRREGNKRARNEKEAEK